MFQPLHILIVERDQNARARLRALLPTSAICVEAETGQAAVAAFATAINRKPFDIVLLSRDLLHMGEVEMVAIFRTVEQWIGCPEQLGVEVVLTQADGELDTSDVMPRSAMQRIGDSEEAREATTSTPTAISDHST